MIAEPSSAGADGPAVDGPAVDSTATDSTATDAPQRSARRGRPRDSAVDQRILAVGRAVYAERGWAGFNFDVVAGQAHVSKDAIYRRYPSKLALLLATIGDAAAAEDPPEAASEVASGIRPSLFALAIDYFERTRSDRGIVSLRIFVESLRNPELLEAYHREQASSLVRRARAVVRRAMDEGLLPLAPSPTAPLDAILGGVVMHVLATPPALWDKMVAESDAYLGDLVDLVLRGCGYDPGPEMNSSTAPTESR